MVDSVHCRVDRDGRLIAADPQLAALNLRAGGAIGEPLAIPQLATLARLARTLGVLISRGVIVADGDSDLDLWVRARPEGDTVDMAVGGWVARAPRSSWLVPQPESEAVSDLPAPDWRWETDAALRLTGVTLFEGDATALIARDVVGQPLTRLVRLIEDGEGDLPILAALSAGTAFHEQRAVRRDRPLQEILLAGLPVHDETGAFKGYRGNATAAPAVADPGGAPLIETGFAEQLSGALREPLGRIVAKADSISAQIDGPLRRDYADYASDIANAGRHLLALVEDLADLQAVEQPGFIIEGEPIDLADIARRAAGLLAVRASGRGVRIDRPDISDGLMAQGDFRRALQILVNLVGNAVRYSPDGSMIWLRTEREGDTAVLIVADQGRGIALEDQVRIFEKFERIDTSEPGGSGLGLYISRRLARAMGGDLTVDSAPGQGARFVLTLPGA